MLNGQPDRQSNDDSEQADANNKLYVRLMARGGVTWSAFSRVASSCSLLFHHHHRLPSFRHSVMRTRRRPVLQDKTPGNTPQKPKLKATRAAKPELVPVVEIKARVRRSKRGKNAEAEEHPDVGDAGEHHDYDPSGTRHGRVQPSEAPAQGEPGVASARKEAAVTHEAPPPKRGRGRPRKVAPRAITRRKFSVLHSAIPVTNPSIAPPAPSPVKTISHAAVRDLDLGELLP